MEFPWSQLLGRLHPLAVHFPIALLIVAGVVELLRPRRGKPSDAGVVCLVFGSLGAIASAWSGWEHAEHLNVGRALETLLWQHRWVGVATASVATLTTLLALAQRRKEGGWTGTLYRLGLVLSVLLVSVGGHLGGALVYGEDYLFELLRDPNKNERGDRDATQEPQARAGDPGVDEFGTAIELSPESDPGPPVPEDPVPGDPVPEDPAPVVAEPEPELVAPADPGGTVVPAEPVASTPDEDPAAPVDFVTQIAPIFERGCYECHGPTGRAKAGLRLSNVADLFEGDPELWIIAPGDAEASLLFELVSLPADDLDLMPPEGRLPDAEIALLRRWIDEGANYPGKKDTPAPAPTDPEGVEEVEEVEDGRVVEEPPAKETARFELTEPQRQACDAALGRLLARGAVAARLSQVSDEVEVGFGLLGAQVGDEDLALLAGLEPALVSLDLSRTSVTAEGLAGLKSFSRLRRLRLDHTELGDAALAHAGVWKELSYLNLVQTAVTDAGLEQLRGLAALRKLYVWGSEVSELGAASLSAALPELEVVRGADLPVPQETPEEESAQE